MTNCECCKGVFSQTNGAQQLRQSKRGLVLESREPHSFAKHWQADVTWRGNLKRSHVFWALGPSSGMPPRPRGSTAHVAPHPKSYVARFAPSLA